MTGEEKGAALIPSYCLFVHSSPYPALSLLSQLMGYIVARVRLSFSSCLEKQLEGEYLFVPHK